MKQNLWIEKIRAAGILNTCPGTFPGRCVLEVERETYNLALYCVSCGWRYDLTDEERERIRQGLHIKGQPSGRYSDPERELQIVQLYSQGMSPVDIGPRVGISSAAVYCALKRQGVKANGRHRKMKSYV